MDIFPPKSFGDWIACLAFFTMITNGLMKMVDRFRGKPGHPPNEQLKNSHDVLQERVEDLETWREELTDKLEADKQTILLSGAQRGQRIYEKIDHEVKGIRDEMREMGRDLTKKCEEIPNEVIATLANAKQFIK